MESPTGGKCNNYYKFIQFFKGQVILLRYLIIIDEEHMNISIIHLQGGIGSWQMCFVKSFDQESK